MVTRGSDNPFPSVLFVEHVDPSNPSAGTQRLFVDTDHVLKLIDSSGTVTTFSGGGFSDPMTTRGDIIIRNASNVTARLGRGSANQVLTSDGTDIAWQTPAAGSSAPLGVTRYLGASDTNYTLGSAADVDTSNTIVTATVPGSGNVVIYVGMMVQNNGGIGRVGLRVSTTTVQTPEMVTNAGSPTWGSRFFYLTGLTPGSTTFKLYAQNILIYHGPTYGAVEMIVWGA